MTSPNDDIRLLYGQPPAKLVADLGETLQVSPLITGSTPLETVPPGSASVAVALAPAGTIERRHDVALILRALAPGAPFTVLAQKTLGGARLAGELAAFGCTVEDSAKSHHRICRGVRPSVPVGLDAAIAEGTPRRLDDLGLWSQPGIFSWDRLDPGTAVLLDVLPDMAGDGADFGCGIGILAHRVLAASEVSRLHLIDIDRRAIEAARRNVADARVAFAWADLRLGSTAGRLDFVVTNPPFHEVGHEDRTLGVVFINRAAEALKPGGRLWLVGNRHLPYEGVLAKLFRRVTSLVERDGFKVFEAQK